MKKLIGLTFFLCVTALSLFIYSSTNSECFFNAKSARSEVADHLSKKGLDPKYLITQSSNPKACEYSYKYIHEETHINFVVTDDTTNGAQVLFWDSTDQQ